MKTGLLALAIGGLALSAGAFAQDRGQDQKIQDLLREFDRNRRLERLKVRINPFTDATRFNSGVHVSVTLQIDPVRGKTPPSITKPYGEGAIVRILDAQTKKVLAEGKTNASGHVYVPAPPGKHLLELITGPPGSGAGPPIEVTVEKDKEAAVGFLVTVRGLIPRDPRFVDPSSISKPTQR
jgi:hypothetical protein